MPEIVEEKKREVSEHIKKIRRRLEEKIRHYNDKKIESLAVILDVNTDTEK